MRGFSFLLLSCTAFAQTIFIEHATVIDATGDPPKRDFAVMIDDGRIASITKAFVGPIAPDTIRIDATGKFLIPGLWDMHVHITAPQIEFPLLVANGVTGIREMYSAVSIQQQRQWAALPDAPRVVVPGFIDGAIARPGGAAWPDAYAVPDADAARAAVQILAAQHADFLKIYNAVPRPAFIALAAQARALGITFVGHVPEAVSPVEASEAGMRSEEHLNNLLLAASTQEVALRGERIRVMYDPAISPAARLRLLGWPLTEGLFDTYDPQKAFRMFQTFVKNGTFQTPTLSVLWGYAHATDADFISDSRLRFLPKAWTDFWNPHGSPYLSDMSPAEYAVLKQRMLALLDRYKKLVGDMAHAGVQILAGTDTNAPNPVLPGWGLHQELALLVDSGLTPLETLQTATRNPARYFSNGNENKDGGTIEPGKFGDLVLLDADPLQDIHNTQKIHAVILRGHYYSRSDLDAMLEKLAKTSANGQ